MEIKQIYEIYDMLEKINTIEIGKIISRNIKKYRLELYNKYKQEYDGRMRYNNPYSSVNMSEYLEITDRHYRRIESENNRYKFLSIEKLIKIAHILNKNINDFLTE